MNKIKTKVDIIYNDFVKKDITIIHISDIHFNINIKKKKLDRIKDYIMKIEANYVMISGDIIDEPAIVKNEKKIKELLDFLTDIAKVSKVIISLGNHDIINEADYKFFNKLNELYNIYVLNNEVYCDDFIYVVGITLPTEYYYNITKDENVVTLLKVLDDNSKIIKDTPKNIPKIILIHSPIKVTEYSVLDKLNDFDLILCGHTHSGMIPDIVNLFYKGNRGIIAPNKKFFPSIARGRIDKVINNKKKTIIINGGITKLSFHSRISGLNFLYNMSVNKIIFRKGRESYNGKN